MARRTRPFWQHFPDRPRGRFPRIWIEVQGDGSMFIKHCYRRSNWAGPDRADQMLLTTRTAEKLLALLKVAVPEAKREQRACQYRGRKSAIYTPHQAARKKTS